MGEKTDWSRLRLFKIMFNEDGRDVEDAVPYGGKNRLEQTSYIEFIVQ